MFGRTPIFTTSDRVSDLTKFVTIRPSVVLLRVPEPLANLAPAIAVIVQMADDNGFVKLSLLKDLDNPNVAKLSLALDPSTMLLVKD